MANIVDPVEMLLKTTKDALDPTLAPPLSSTSAASHTPLPTVFPHETKYETVTHDGKVTLWVVFVIMLVASIIFTGLSWRVPVSKRLYHIITTLITVIAAISYFAMASGHGVALHHIKTSKEVYGGGETTVYVERQVFWARYVDWSLTTPLLLLDLFLLAGSNGATIFLAIVADIIMILTGLFAAFGSGHTAQKWGWYTIACIAYLVIVWHLVLNGRSSAAAKGGNVSKFFTSIAGFTLLVWTAYPIVWGVADGGRHATVDAEIIAYAVLDVLAKPIFGIWLLLTHQRMPETNVEIGGFWSKGFGDEGRIRIGDDDEGA